MSKLYQNSHSDARQDPSEVLTTISHSLCIGMQEHGREGEDGMRPTILLMAFMLEAF